MTVKRVCNSSVVLDALEVDFLSPRVTSPPPTWRWKERDATNRPTMLKPARISRSEFLQEYKSAVARKLKVFTSREYVAMSREALREVLAEGRVVLRPDVANARFEGSLVLSHEEFIEQKQ